MTPTDCTQQILLLLMLQKLVGHIQSWISGSVLEANYIELISTEISSAWYLWYCKFWKLIFQLYRLKIDSNGLFSPMQMVEILIFLVCWTVDNYAKKFTNNANITAEILSITTDEFPAVTTKQSGALNSLNNCCYRHIFSLLRSNIASLYAILELLHQIVVSLIIGGDFDYVADYPETMELSLLMLSISM